MAIAKCENGHIYDSDYNTSCPYCNQNQNRINFGETTGGNRYGGGSVTDGQPTMAPRGYENYQGDQSVVNMRKTMPPNGYRATGRMVDEENKTVGMMGKSLGIEPVVGWLVCVDGKMKGKSYNLYAKINTIGRSEKMDVCIGGDNTISYDNHARLAYDIKHNNFQLLPGNSSNTLYLNDQPVYDAKMIRAYDVIELGSTLLLFVPFCTEQFDWSKDIREEMKMGGLYRTGNR